MTGLPPAGWYPDPTNPQRPRWWDGAAWTDLQPAPLSAPGVNTQTPWIWLMLIPALVPALLVLFVDWHGYIEALVNAAASDAPGELIIQALQKVAWIYPVTLLCAAASIVFAWLDWRELKARGIPKPFPWPWAFFALFNGGILVYVIGRSVVVKRRTGTGLLPLWVWIAAMVASWIFASVVVSALTGSISMAPGLNA